MKRFGLMRLWFFFCLTALCLAAAPARAQMQDLGTLGGDNSTANGINNKGEVVGTAEDASGNSKAFRESIYEKIMKKINTPETYTYAFAVNDQGVLVGAAKYAGTPENGIVVASSGSLSYLGPPGTPSAAVGINQYGVIVGGIFVQYGTPLFCKNAVKWLKPGGQSNSPGDMAASDYVMYNLGTFGGDNSEARAINDLDQVVGYAQYAAGQKRAFLYTGIPGVDGVMHDLGTLGGNFSEAVGINNLGQIVGSSTTAAGNEHAFLYTGVPGAGGVMHDLGTLGGPHSWAYAINDRGQIVGTAQTAAKVTHAFLYTGVPGVNGAMQDLGTLPGGANSWAKSINNNGLIVGHSTTAAGTLHAFLYTPPGPAPALLLLLSEWLRPLTGWGRPPSLALPPAAGLGGMEGRFKRG